MLGYEVSARTLFECSDFVYQAEVYNCQYIIRSKFLCNCKYYCKYAYHLLKTIFFKQWLYHKALLYLHSNDGPRDTIGSYCTDRKCLNIYIHIYDIPLSFISIPLACWNNVSCLTLITCNVYMVDTMWRVCLIKVTV